MLFHCFIFFTNQHRPRNVSEQRLMLTKFECFLKAFKSLRLSIPYRNHNFVNPLKPRSKYIMLLLLQPHVIVLLLLPSQSRRKVWKYVGGGGQIVIQGLTYSSRNLGVGGREVGDCLPVHPDSDGPSASWIPRPWSSPFRAIMDSPQEIGSLPT